MTQKTEIIEKRLQKTVIRRRTEIVPVTAVEPINEECQPSSLPEAEPQATAKTATAGPLAAKRYIDLPPKPDIKVIKAEDLAKSATAPKKVLAGDIAGELKKTTTAPALVADADDEDKKSHHKVAKKKQPRGMEIDGIGRVNTTAQLSRIAYAGVPDRVFEPTRNRGGRRKKIISRKHVKHTQVTETKAIKRIIEMQGAIRVGELAGSMGIKAGELIKKLMDMGTMATLNQELDFATAVMLAQEYKFEVKDISFSEETFLGKAADQALLEKKISRPPVVTVMGHVDHGKTSLLDAIRSTHVTDGEFGGITQHIGAYTVTLAKGPITFLDTPGHEAFTAMRARGAKVTDVVILIVAADDGIMPQTIESIDHARAAGVPIVVAINKIDKPDADLDRVKRQLADHNLAPEEWGGQTLVNLISAKQKQGIEDLLESVLLQAEMLDLKADPLVPARGIVVEAELDRQKGPVATVLVQDGTLKIGDLIIAGSAYGRVRAMLDQKGHNTDKAPPSYAVEVLGLDAVPRASDLFHVVKDEQVASKIVDHRRAKVRQASFSVKGKISLEDFFAQSQAKDVKELNVIIKTDVQGSLEAVVEALKNQSTEKVKLKVIHSAVGGINESDVLLASAADAIIIGFNVRPETKAIAIAERESIDIKLYKIIYEMVADVKLAMQGLLTPIRKEKYLGRAQVRQTFKVSKVGTIAGCFVVDGKIARSGQLRLLRDNVVIAEGKVASLKRFKDDAREVGQNMECGIAIEGYQDIKDGDQIEAFEIQLIQQEM